MVKNEELIGNVIDIGSNGEGIIKIDGVTVFVPFCLVGEKIKFKVLKVDKNVAYGKMTELINKSEDRVNPRCPVYGKCGGCQLQHCKYIKQLDIKRNTIKNCFNKIANIDFDVLPTVESEKIFEYRNKLQLPVQNSGGKNVIGFYSENSHRIIEIEDCAINPTWTKNVIKAFKKFLSFSGISGYISNKKGAFLREITVKDVNGKLIITAVVTSEKGLNTQLLLNTLKEEIQNDFSLFINVNNSTSNVIYGEKFVKIYGEDELDGEMLGIKFKTGVLSFMQVNTSMCEKLYGKVVSLIGQNDKATVIDAYSGAGLMTALLCKNAKKAIGIEVVPEAVEKANQLDIENGLQDRITNYLGKCEDLLPTIIERERRENESLCLVIDPPRKGCDKKVVEAVIKSLPDKIVYVSCMPSTLARDVGLITGSLVFSGNEIIKSESQIRNYTVEYVQGFDMFPETKHVETIVMLSKIKQ